MSFTDCRLELNVSGFSRAVRDSCRGKGVRISFESTEEQKLHEMIAHGKKFRQCICELPKLRSRRTARLQVSLHAWPIWHARLPKMAPARLLGRGPSSSTLRRFSSGAPGPRR